MTAVLIVDVLPAQRAAQKKSIDPGPGQIK
jgi:hypothetical protein